MNSDAGGVDESAQMHNDDAAGVNTPVVNHSDVQGGWTSAGGKGNINADPLFVDADGDDNAVGTADDNHRLSTASPCIDSAASSLYFGAIFDPSGDGRAVDDGSALNTGAGPLTYLDMGAYELQSAQLNGDLDHDGDVDLDDFALFMLPFTGPF